MAGSPEPESSASFRDVSAKADYAKAVAWAAENGIVAGTSKNYFSPNLALTKKQALPRKEIEELYAMLKELEERDEHA